MIRISLAESAAKDAIRLMLPGEWTPIEDVVALTSLSVKDLRSELIKASKSGAIEADFLFQHFRRTEGQMSKESRYYPDLFLSGCTNSWQTARAISSSIGFDTPNVFYTAISVLIREEKIEKRVLKGSKTSEYKLRSETKKQPDPIPVYVPADEVASVPVKKTDPATSKEPKPKCSTKPQTMKETFDDLVEETRQENDLEKIERMIENIAERRRLYNIEDEKYDREATALPVEKLQDNRKIVHDVAVGGISIAISWTNKAAWLDDQQIEREDMIELLDVLQEAQRAVFGDNG